MLNIVKLYKEGQSLMLMQITECGLPCHGEALTKGLDARCQERNLVLAHISNIFKKVVAISLQRYKE